MQLSAALTLAATVSSVAAYCGKPYNVPNPANCLCGTKTTKLIMQTASTSAAAAAVCSNLPASYGFNWVLAPVPTAYPQLKEQQGVLSKCLDKYSYAQVWIADNKAYARSACGNKYAIVDAPDSPAVNRFVMCQLDVPVQPAYQYCGGFGRHNQYYKSCNSSSGANSTVASNSTNEHDCHDWIVAPLDESSDLSLAQLSIDYPISNSTVSNSTDASSSDASSSQSVAY